MTTRQSDHKTTPISQVPLQRTRDYEVVRPFSLTAKNAKSPRLKRLNLLSPNSSFRKEPSPQADEFARLVIGAAIEVHQALGPGYLESVYEKALRVEFDVRGIPFENQLKVQVTYRDQVVGQGRVDFVIGGILPVEIKAVAGLLPVHQAQLISYLKMTNLQLGLLVNFNVPLLKHGIKRVIFNA
jgi:GxxExxY protein